MKRIFLCTLLVVLSLTAEARRNNDRGDRGGDNGRNNDQVYAEPAADAKDGDIIRAMNGHKNVNFVEGAGMVVTRLLPDDNSGLKHQKWMVRLSDGREMEAVYNSDMCPRVPVKVGDVVSMGGMFLWLGHNGMIHWLHHDPRGNRPDGYVELNGTFYCKN